VLLAIVDRRPYRPDASVIEVSEDGTLYLPRWGWTSDDARDDWPGSLKLETVEGIFARPTKHAGLATYCIWSNLAPKGVKGIAVVRDISHPSRDLEFLEQNRPHSNNDDSDWHTPTTVHEMYLPGRVLTQGTAIAAPIFVQSIGGRATQIETTCIGALNITHKDPGHFCTPDNYVWAQECGALLGILYSVCRDRLIELNAFADWEALDNAILHGATSRSAVSSIPPVPFDMKPLRDDIERLRGSSKWETIADEMNLGVRTLQEAMKGRKCSGATAEKMAAWVARKNAEPTGR